MAAAFVAMNQVYGELFSVGVAEAAEPEAAAARQAALRAQPVIDVQLHFLREDFAWDGILMLGEWAKRWNPVLAKNGVTLQSYKFENFVKEVFLDSDTDVGLISGAPSDDPAHGVIGSAALASARDTINAVAGSRRMLSHAILRPGPAGLGRGDRPGARRVEARQLEGLHRRRPARAVEVPVAHGRREGHLPRLGEDREVEPPDRLRAQGAAARRLRDVDRALALRHGRRRGQGGEGLAAAHVRDLPLGPEAVPDCARRVTRAVRVDRANGLGDRPRGGPREVRRHERVRRARHLVRHLGRHAPAPRRGAARHLDQGDGRGPRAVGHRLGLVRLAAVADRGVPPDRDPRGHAEEARLRAARPGRRPDQARDPRGQRRAPVRDRPRDARRTRASADALAAAKREYEAAGTDRSNTAYGFIRPAI